jgi:hypothetical protein
VTTNSINPINPILTRKQFDDTVAEMQKGYLIGSTNTLFKSMSNVATEMHEVMWRLIDTYRVELLGVRADGGFVWGFNNTPTGVVTYENYNGKDREVAGSYITKTRLVVTSPFIRKERGNKNAVVSNSAKGMVARLSSEFIKPAVITNVISAKDLVRRIATIGSHSPAPSYQSMKPEAVEALLGCLDPDTNNFGTDTSPELLITWAKECREAKAKAEKYFEKSKAVRRSFQEGMLIFATIEDTVTPKKMLMIRMGKVEWSPAAPVPAAEELEVRWIDSFDEIVDEYPHVSGINNLMRMSFITEIKCGLIAPWNVPIESSFHYSPTYGFLRGRREVKPGLGMFTFAAVPATPISNDTEKEESKQPTSARQMSALFDGE